MKPRTERRPASKRSQSGDGKSPTKWNLRLYVAGDSPKSKIALENLTRLCELHLRDNYNIEVVDLRKKPELARADEILAVPTLIRKIPEPMKRVIGDLSNSERALLALELRQ
ncbi:MAG: circadian clock KaiB family protein [Myxococcota bacterium]